MPPSPKHGSALPRRWQVAALSLVLLAVGLAGAGTYLVVHQMRSLTDSVLDQAAVWARQVAEAPGRPNDSPTALALRPTGAFVQQQERAVVVYTLVYVGLTFAALITLLVAVGILVRLVRRERALGELQSNFVADVSHELKTPLAVIRLYGETLQSGRITTEEKRQEYYTVITRESTRLANLINSILDFARIESGRNEYALQPTDVAEVVRETYATYQAELDRNRFEHKLTVADDLPRIDADRDAIARILFNLMNNAVKYCGEDRYLAIEVSKDTRRGRHGVLISVHDRGIGIRPQDRAHLFEGFFRAADVRVREQGGTGLGLALVKHIVEAHGGSLDVEPRLVKGTTFRVFLPAAPPAASGAEAPGGQTESG